MLPIKAMFGPGIVVEVPAGTYEDTAIDPDDAGVIINFATNGTGTVVTSAAPIDFTWLTGGSSSDFEIRWTNTFGTPSTGTTGSWLPFNQSWSVVRTSVGTKTNTATVEIRRVSDSVVVASGSITITATVDI